MEIKVKLLNPNCEPYVNPNGDWIDLRASKIMLFHAPQSGVLRRKKGNEESFRDVTFDRKLIPLGVAMQLPKGFEAVVLPRSSTPNNEPKGFGLMSANAEGVIDHSYQGNSDEWMFNALAIRHTVVAEGDRVCQFRIQLSQKATTWQKLKWLFSNKITLKYVDSLEGEDRGGFGTTLKN